jgi:hypothetical protein
MTAVECNKQLYFHGNIRRQVHPFILLSKCKISDNYVVETKLLPLLYGQPESYGLIRNNFYIGLHYWFSDTFSLGLRYNGYGENDNLSLLFSWNFL